MARAICQSNKDLNDDLLLGYLFFYNLGDISLDEIELENIFIANGMDSKYIRKISKIDAFRRATSSTRGGIMVSYNGEQKKARLEVDEVKCDKDMVVRLLGRKLVDEKNEKLSYRAVGRIVYDRDNEDMSIITDPAYWNEFNYSDVLDDAKQKYLDWSSFHTKDTVRNITNAILKEMHPVNLLPTGIAKFIPKTSKDTLYSLKGIIEDLSAFGSNCIFEIIPVVDTEEQRDLINKAAANEVQEELHNFTQELREVIQQKQLLSTRSAVSYIEKFKDLKSKVSEYENLLGTYMTILNQQIQQAIGLVSANTEEDSIAKGA